jgi:hypothetical protein
MSENQAEPRNRQGPANPHTCTCGYDGISQADLNEHIRAASRSDNEHHTEAG